MLRQKRTRFKSFIFNFTASGLEAVIYLHQQRFWVWNPGTQWTKSGLNESVNRLCTVPSLPTVKYKITDKVTWSIDGCLFFKRIRHCYMKYNWWMFMTTGRLRSHWTGPQSRFAVSCLFRLSSSSSSTPHPSCSVPSQPIRATLHPRTQQFQRVRIFLQL